MKEADQARLTRFATKQGTTFQQVAATHPELAKVDSVVLAVHQADGGDDFFVRSSAIRRLIEGCRGFDFLRSFCG